MRIDNWPNWQTEWFMYMSVPRVTHLLMFFKPEYGIILIEILMDTTSIIEETNFLFFLIKRLHEVAYFKSIYYSNQIVNKYLIRSIQSFTLFKQIT